MYQNEFNFYQIDLENKKTQTYVSSKQLFDSSQHTYAQTTSWTLAAFTSSRGNFA